jgi:hypothetical protein
MTSMVGPLGGAVPVRPIASTTEFEDNVDGKPPRGRCRQVWQRPPPRFEDYIDGGPPGGVAGGSDSVHHRVLKTTLMAGPLGVLRWVR